MKRKGIIHCFFKPVGSSANFIQAKNPNAETPNVEVETNDHVENPNNQTIRVDPGKRIQI